MAWFDVDLDRVLDEIGVTWPGQGYWQGQSLGQFDARVLALPPHLRKKVQTSELSIPYDAVINIARIDSPEVQEQLIDELLAGGSVRDIRDRIADHKGQARKPRDGEERW